MTKLIQNKNVTISVFFMERNVKNSFCIKELVDANFTKLDVQNTHLLRVIMLTYRHPR